MRRYTDGQMRLLKLDPDKLNEEERGILHRLLLPRTSYLPADPVEQDALARDWLGEGKYAELLAFCEMLRAHYGDGMEFCWSRGEKEWGMYRLVRLHGKSLCRFGIMYRSFRLIVLFGARECAEFERLRATFPRDRIQWTYDAVTERRGVRPLYLDLGEEGVLPHALRLLSIKSAPRVPFSVEKGKE